VTFVSHASNEFWELYRSLPPDIQRQADKQFELFCQNPLHPSLRLKPVGQVWSARVNQAYRALPTAKVESSTGFGSAPTRSTNGFLGSDTVTVDLLPAALPS
jgi:hypothetical protein